jgi:hypothetical protein
MTASESNPGEGERSDGSTDSESTEFFAAAEVRAFESATVEATPAHQDVSLSVRSEGLNVRVMMSREAASGLVDELTEAVESVESNEV